MKALLNHIPLKSIMRDKCHFPSWSREGSWVAGKWGFFLGIQEDLLLASVVEKIKFIDRLSHTYSDNETAYFLLTIYIRNRVIIHPPFKLFGKWLPGFSS